MNCPKKPGFDLYQSRHRAYTTYKVKTWFSKILCIKIRKNILFQLYGSGSEMFDRDIDVPRELP